MRYAGISMGMWALFAPSFRNQRIGSKARNRKVPGFFYTQILLGLFVFLEFAVVRRLKLDREL